MALTAEHYSVDLDVFQGPLDLLLYLIRKEEIDIYDIPVARITEQYLEYVRMLKLLNLENAGDYILMAATLIRIKAQMLLPRDSVEMEEFDPREELTRALLEYSRFKEASDILMEKRLSESRLTPLFGRANGYHTDPVVLVEGTSLFDLLTAFHGVMAAFGDENAYLVTHEDITIEDRIEVILKRLSGVEFATFEELFADVKTKIVAVVTLLAILELARNHRISIRQAIPFSEIRIYRTDHLIQTIGPITPVGERATDTPLVSNEAMIDR